MTDTLFPLPVMFTPATAEENNTTELAIADTLGLTTTQWEQGAPERTIFAVMANMFAMADKDISILAQGAFLDYAATGTVAYTDPVSGLEVTVYVTPDPSDPSQNPDGTLGLLDVLASSVYNVLRTIADYAGGTLAILNTSASTYGPFDAGSYHVAQPGAAGSPTYANTDSLTIAPSATVDTVADASNTSPIEITTSGAHGLTTGDTVFVSDVAGNTAANGAWTITVTGSDTFELDGSAGNSAYTSGGTVYTPTLASFKADIKGTASNAAEANLIITTVTTLIGVSVANLAPFLGADTQSNVELAATCRLKLQSLSPNGPKGAYEYFAKKAHELAPLLTPPLTVSSPITRTLTRTDVTTGAVITAIANAAGAPSGADVSATNAVFQAYCVPWGVTAIAQAAAANTMAVVINAWVPAAYATAFLAVAQISVQTFFAVLAIGGVTDPTESSPNTNIVPYNAVLGAVWAGANANKIPVQQLTGTLDGGTANVQLDMDPVPEVAVLSPSTPTVNVIPV